MTSRLPALGSKMLGKRCAKPRKLLWICKNTCAGGVWEPLLPRSPTHSVHREIGSFGTRRIDCRRLSKQRTCCGQITMSGYSVIEAGTTHGYAEPDRRFQGVNEGTA